MSQSSHNHPARKAGTSDTSRNAKPNPKSPTNISIKSKRSLREKVLDKVTRKITLSEGDSVYGTPNPETPDMELDPLLQEIDLQASAGDYEDSASVFTNISEESVTSRRSMLPTHTTRGIGVVMDEAIRHANDMLQKGKIALEEAGNMKRECKATTLECLQSLYETALALSDSRSRHKYNLEKERCRHAQELVRAERAHAKETATIRQSLVEQLSQTRSELERTLSATSEIKKWLSFETTGPFQEISEVGKSVTRLERMLEEFKCTEQDTKGGINTDKRINVIQTEIQRLNENIRTVSNQVDTLRRTLETISTISTLNKNTEHPQYHIKKIEDTINPKMESMVKELEELKTLIREQGKSKIRNFEDQDQIIDTEDLKKEMRNGFQGIKADIHAIIEPCKVIQASVEEVRKEVKNSIETTVETVAPIRMAVEDLKTKLKQNKDTHKDIIHTERQQDKQITKETSYAAKTKERIKNAQFNIQIESTEPNLTSDDVLKSVKSSIDVISLGIGINKIRKIKNQKLVIGCNNEENRQILKDKLNENNKSLIIKQLENKRPLIKIIGVVDDLNDTQIPEAIIKQNRNLIEDASIEQIRVQRRTKGRTKHLTNVILQVAPSIWHRLVDQKIHLGYQIVPVVDQSPIMQCFRCLGFGHTAKDCRNEQRCGHCTMDHDTRSCPSRNVQPRCLNCQGEDDDHPAYSSVCPKWRKWDAIARSMISYC